MSNEAIDYKLAAEQLRTGKPLFGKDGALAPMLERILNAALEGGIPIKGYGNSVGIQAKDPFDIPKTVAQENIPRGRKRKVRMPCGICRRSDCRGGGCS